MLWGQGEENAPYLMTYFFQNQSLCEKVAPMNNFVHKCSQQCWTLIYQWNSLTNFNQNSEKSLKIRNPTLPWTGELTVFMWCWSTNRTSYLNTKSFFFFEKRNRVMKNESLKTTQTVSLQKIYEQYRNP